MALHLRYVSHSETGLVRKNNQDSGYASPHLLLVADGMGGAAAGDLASAVAVDVIRRVDTETDGEHMLEVLAGALHRANDRIADLVDDDYTLEGMGTTVTGALFDGSELGLAHIGDSRAYLLRENRLERLTHDHSWVQSLVDEGKISEEEAAYHPHRSLLLKVLNGQPAADPDLTRLPVQAGDRLLFCSDGLCGLVEDPVIAETLRQPDLAQVTAALVAAAHAAGGIDNITIILADVVESDGSADVSVLGAAQDRVLPQVGARSTGVEAPGDHRVADPVAADRAGAEPGSVASGAVVSGAVASAATAASPPTQQSEAEDDGDDDEARYNPQAPQRRRLVRPLVVVLSVMLVLGAGLGAAYAWTRTQFYVGAATDQVAIFQGLSAAVPVVELSRVYEVQPLLIAGLPPYYQEMVRAGIPVAGLDSARQTVVELTETARRCATQPTPAPRPAASPRPVASETPAPSQSPADPRPASPSSTAQARVTPTTPLPSISAAPAPTTAAPLPPAAPSITPPPSSGPPASGSATAAPTPAASTVADTPPSAEQAC